MKKLNLAVFLICAALFVQTSAQTAVDTEKQAAIKEYLAVMNESVKVADLMNAFDGQMNDLASKMFAATVKKDSRLTEAELTELQDLFFNPQTGFLKRQQDKLLKNLDLEALVNELTYKIYDKHFTLTEIREMTAFYRTPTGQKLLKSTPEIMQETLTEMFEKLTPKFMEINEQLSKDLQRELDAKFNELVAKRKKTADKAQ